MSFSEGISFDDETAQYAEGIKDDVLPACTTPAQDRLLDALSKLAKPRPLTHVEKTALSLLR